MTSCGVNGGRWCSYQVGLIIARALTRSMAQMLEIFLFLTNFSLLDCSSAAYTSNRYIPQTKTTIPVKRFHCTTALFHNVEEKFRRPIPTPHHDRKDMEEDRAATNLGPEPVEELNGEQSSAPKQPKRRFVGRKTAAGAAAAKERREKKKTGES